MSIGDRVFPDWGQGFFNLGRGIFKNTTSPINYCLILDTTFKSTKSVKYQVVPPAFSSAY